MPQPTNVISRYNINSVREDLLDKIFMVENEETPLLSSIERKKAKQTTHEWQTDTLRAANAANAAIEGDDTALNARTPTVKVGNFTQIFKDVVGSSDTAEEVNKAGYDGQLKRERMKLMIEQKRDMEAAFLSNAASVAGNNTTPRRLGGLEAWITTNVSPGAGYVNGGHAGGGGGVVTAPTDGTQRAFTVALLDGVMEQAFTNGAKPKQLFMSPSKKTAFAAFNGIAANRVDLKTIQEGAVITGVDVYQSNFGKLTIVPSIHIRNRTVMGIDPDYIAMASLGDRLMKEAKLAKTGDNERMHIVSEVTLQVQNQRGQFKIADLL